MEENDDMRRLVALLHLLYMGSSTPLNGLGEQMWTGKGKTEAADICWTKNNVGDKNGMGIFANGSPEKYSVSRNKLLQNDDLKLLVKYSPDSSISTNR